MAAGNGAPGRVDRGDRAWLVQWRKRQEVGELADDDVVDDDRSRERQPTVHDAVPDHVDRARLVGQLRDARVVAVPLREIVFRDNRIVIVEDRQLERARPGVDDKTFIAVASRALVHCQSRTSGRSSPNSRVYCWWRVRSSTMCWRTCAARVARPGTRSITSMTRWKRSMSLRTSMSKGVVTVPSSL